MKTINTLTLTVPKIKCTQCDMTSAIAFDSVGFENNEIEINCHCNICQNNFIIILKQA